MNMEYTAKAMDATLFSSNTSHKSRGDTPLGVLHLPTPLKPEYNRRKKLIELIEKPLWTVTGKRIFCNS